MKSNSGKVNEYGMHTAKAMAGRRLLNSALEAIRTGRGERSGQCYRDAAKVV